MDNPSLPETGALEAALACKCPACKQGTLYQPGWEMKVNDFCPSCGLALHENDTADGPAVFLIFMLGFLLVPCALLFETLFAPPLWVHAVLWGVIAIFMTIAVLKPVKACVIALQYKHRHSEWGYGPKTGTASKKQASTNKTTTGKTAKSKKKTTTP